MKLCIGFCQKPPCNCNEILELHNKFRREKLRCAELREKGAECTCPTVCDKTADYWREEIEKHTFENWYKINQIQKLKKEKCLKDLDDQVKEIVFGKAYRWLTIALPNSYTPKKVFEKISQLVKNKPFKEYLYCMEFAGKDGNYNPHIHLLYRKIDKPNRDDKAICRKFKIEDHFIHKVNISENNLNEKIEYIVGNKKQEKMDQVERDIKILKENNLKKYYYNNFPINNIDASKIQEKELKEKTTPIS